METVKSFITGAGGFMGSHLVDFLTAKGHEVSGIYFGPVNLTDEIKNKDHLFECDIRDKKELESILVKYKPNYIYHLAAQSYPTVSWRQPTHTIDVNVNGTINLFEIVKKHKLKCRILNAGSSAEYGKTLFDPKYVPVTEEAPLRPLHPYGVSKVAQEGLVFQYFENFQIDGFTMRIFNTTGPRKQMDVCSDFTRQVALANLGIKKEIFVGNLETKRTIIDVRDTIVGFYMAMEVAKPGESYNISSEEVHQIKDILDKARSFCKNKDINVIKDQTLMRPTDEPAIVGDCAKFWKVTGWKPKITLKKTIEDMVEYWTEKFKQTA